MATETVKKLKCDLCRRQAECGQHEKTAKGWVSFDRENPMEDRAWIHHDICDRCVKLIRKASD